MENKQIDTETPMLFQEISEGYLADESGGLGWAAGLCLPRSAQEACRGLREAQNRKMPVTIQGGKTGICGGAVPEGGLVMNLSRMDQLVKAQWMETGSLLICVQAGMTLSALTQMLDSLGEGEPYFFPINPTEGEATIGGIAACHTEGSRAAYYGPLENWVEEIEAADLSGELHRFPREELASVLGDEGEHYVILSVTLCLEKAPRNTAALLCPFGSAGEIAAIAQQASSRLQAGRLTMAEWIGRDAARLLAECGKETGLAGLPRSAKTGAYALLELTADSEEELMDGLENLLGLLEEYGCDTEAVLAADTHKEVERLMALRHSLNEAAAQRMRADVSRTGRPPLLIDVCLPPERMEEFLREASKQTEGAQASWGHAACGHIHLHLFYKTAEEYDRQREAVCRLLDQAIRMGGYTHREFGRGKCRTHDGKPVVYEKREEEEQIWRSQYV